jgi:hypothetical protein
MRAPRLPDQELNCPCRVALPVRHAQARARAREGPVFRKCVILSTTLAGPPPKLGYFDQNGDDACRRIEPDG